MVTKEQQLEWLAEEFDMWPNIKSCAIKMSIKSIGCEALLDGECHTITRQEWQHERNKMSSKPEVDNSWHEHGELPPVGCECVWADESGVFGAAGVGYPDIGDVVSICAHKQTPGGDVIAIFTWAPGGNGLCVAASRMPEDFRPLRTEREKAIDEIAASIGANFRFDGYYLHARITRSLSEVIYDAGYRKVKP